MKFGNSDIQSTYNEHDYIQSKKTLKMSLSLLCKQTWSNWWILSDVG